MRHWSSALIVATASLALTCAAALAPGWAQRNTTQAPGQPTDLASLPDVGARLYPFLPVRLLATIKYASGDKVAELGVPHARRVQDHEQGPVGEVLRTVDQAGDFLGGQDYRESTRDFREGDVFQQVRPLQRLHEEEPERGDVELDRARPELPLAQQVRLIRPQVRPIELIR